MADLYDGDEEQGHEEVGGDDVGEKWCGGGGFIYKAAISSSIGRISGTEVVPVLTSPGGSSHGPNVVQDVCSTDFDWNTRMRRLSVQNTGVDGNTRTSHPL